MEDSKTHWYEIIYRPNLDFDPASLNEKFKAGYEEAGLKYTGYEYHGLKDGLHLYKGLYEVP
jgi:hypothetical protein